MLNTTNIGIKIFGRDNSSLQQMTREKILQKRGMGKLGETVIICLYTTFY